MVRAMTLVTLAVGLFAGLASGAGPLEGKIEARKVVQADGGREAFIPANEAVPNDVIEYRLRYANNGEAPIRGVVVTDPIPVGTRYVSMTATRPATGAVEFSIDGGRQFHDWPVRYRETLEDGSEVWKEATPDMVTHIRWTISGDFEPETEITFTYRTVVL